MTRLVGRGERVFWISLVCVLAALVVILGSSYWQASDDARFWARVAMDRAFFYGDNQTGIVVPESPLVKGAE